MGTEKKSSWLERVEELIHVIEGSSISELELAEGDLEIIVRRQPAMVLVAATQQVITGTGGSAGAANAHSSKVEQGITVAAPMTGVYYSAASPTTPSFVNLGDVI